MSEWILVDHDLPEPYRSVTVRATKLRSLGNNARPDGEYEGFYADDDKQWNCYSEGTGDGHNSFRFLCECDVSEWKPIPDAPPETSK